MRANPACDARNRPTRAEKIAIKRPPLRMAIQSDQKTVPEMEGAERKTDF